MGMGNWRALGFEAFLNFQGKSKMRRLDVLNVDQVHFVPVM